MSALAAAQAEILALKDQLAAQRHELKRKERELAAKNEALSSREEQLQQLRCQIDWLKRQLFGSKSERLDRRQLELQLLNLQARAAKLQAEPPPSPARERKAVRPRPSRQERYGHLPVRETIVIEPGEVTADPEAFEKIGQEETFELDVDPPRFYRRRIVRPKYRRKADRESAPVVAAAPRRPVEGIASIGLLVHLILSKYCDHLPLFRQARIYERSGVQLSRQSMMRWVQVVADWLKPVYGHMRTELLCGGYIQADETPIKYLDADLKSGKAQQGYLCGYSRPGDGVVFTWRTSRSTASLTDFLMGYEGILQCDAYAAYQRFARENKGIRLIGCMAHVRRKFEEALKDHPKEAAVVILLMGHLYDCERFCRLRGFSPKLTALRRQTHARPVFERLHRAINRFAIKSLPQSSLRSACRYALNQWKHIEGYLDPAHGHVQIDNNLMENAIRPSAIGKKNWLFVGHPDAGDRPAIIYSLLVSCQRLGHDPRLYLTDVLTRLTEEQDPAKPRNIEALTPRNWKPRA